VAYKTPAAPRVVAAHTVLLGLLGAAGLATSLKVIDLWNDADTMRSLGDMWESFCPFASLAFVVFGAAFLLRALSTPYAGAARPHVLLGTALLLFGLGLFVAQGVVWGVQMALGDFTIPTAVFQDVDRLFNAEKLPTTLLALLTGALLAAVPWSVHRSVRNAPHWVTLEPDPRQLWSGPYYVQPPPP